MPRRIYHCNNLVEAGYIQGLIESHGIPCHLINGNLQGGAGELPVLDCGPEIWIDNEHDEQQAKQIIQESQKPQAGSGRNCPQCGEHLPPQFTDCWNCTQSNDH